MLNVNYDIQSKIARIVNHYIIHIISENGANLVSAFNEKLESSLKISSDVDSLCSLT